MSKHRGNASVVAMVAALSAWLAAAPTMAVDDLSFNVAAGSESVMPGDTVTVNLDVADLSAAINGVQALIHYDNTMLTLVDVVETDLGLISPAEGWIEVMLADYAGDVDYAAVVNGDYMAGGGTIATFTFTATNEGTTNVTFRPDEDPYYTKLTVAADNSTIYPATWDSGSITSDCDDGLYCNGVETFSGGSCQTGTAPDCSVLTDQCNDGVCNEDIDACEAQPVNEGGGCDDQDMCTDNDVCTSGDCGGTAIDCSHLDDVCNVGTCNPSDGSCEATPTNEGGSCDDGVFCNGTDACNSGVCVSSGDPCAPMLCDEDSDSCVAPVHVAGLEVFYAGRYLDAADTSKSFLAVGSMATNDNILNYVHGITGIRVIFDNIVTFATTPQDAFMFEWTTGTGTTFSFVTDPASSITITDAVDVDVTVVTIDLADDYILGRWLKVTIDATQITVGGIELDGEMIGNPVALPSGDGTLGGDAVFYLGTIPGDVNGDRKNSLTDVGIIRAEVNPFMSVPITNIYDVDKSGKVMLADAHEGRLAVNPFFTLPLITP